MGRQKTSKSRLKQILSKPISGLEAEAPPSREHLLEVTSWAAVDGCWLYVDALHGRYATVEGEDGAPELVAFTTEKSARIESGHSELLDKLVTHHVEIGEFLQIAIDQCAGRFRIFWASPAAHEIRLMSSPWGT